METTKQVAHTPGPWIADGMDKESLIVNSQWGEVARVQGNGDYRQRDANARLIAAAPELVEGLEAQLDAVKAQLELSQIREWSIGSGDKFADCRLRITRADRLAKAALAKAKGQ